jgi:hypothetical protein
LQLDGGSRPFARPLWLASMSARISALGGFGFAVEDMDGVVMV